MRIKVNDQITVNAPANKLWRVIAHEFDDIGQWSSEIAESKAIMDRPAPEGVKVGGRVCLSPGSGADATEAFTYYDEQEMRLGYEAIGKLPMPWLLKYAENNWRVHSLNPRESVAEFRAEIEVLLFPGLLLLPLMPFIKKALGSRTLEELKYYVEHDKPHPRKLKAQQKQIK